MAPLFRSKISFDIFDESAFKSLRTLKRKFQEQRRKIWFQLMVDNSNTEADNHPEVILLREKYITELRQNFDTQILAINNDRILSWFTSATVFSEDYERHLVKFKSLYHDADEMDFLKELINYSAIDQRPLFVEDLGLRQKSNIKITLEKKRQFLELKALQNQFSVEYILNQDQTEELVIIEPINSNSALIQSRKGDPQSDNHKNQENAEYSKLSWTGSEIELAELLKALCEAKVIKASTDKEVFEEFSKFFGIELDKTQKLQTIKKRTKHGEKAKFLNDLSQRLERWIDDSP